MNQYSIFSLIYDDLMDNNDYDLWVNNLIKIFNKYKFRPKKIFELGCGTGNITRRLYNKGYSIIGSDISTEMLDIAQQKSFENNLKIKYLKQDMSNITYNKKVDCVLSICDGLNYIINEKKLTKTFSNIYNTLSDKGLFIFDISTIYKFKNIINDKIFSENFENFTYIWDNEYNPKDNILNFQLTVFIKENDHFQRYIENHIQKGHKVNNLKEIIKPYFKVLDIVNTNTLEKHKNNDKRVLFVLRKK
ncbi:MAG: class I SAM-dependent DNA methyltransferase [Bacillota bacterium]